MIYASQDNKCIMKHKFVTSPPAPLLKGEVELSPIFIGICTPRPLGEGLGGEGFHKK